MKRHTGHYLKPARKASSPSSVFTIVVDSKNIESSNTKVYSEAIFNRAAATYTFRRNGKWSLPKQIETDNPDELRKWVELTAHKTRRNYVVCPIASNVLTLTKWWSHVESIGATFASSGDASTDRNENARAGEGYQVRRCILRGRPDIFDYTFAFKRYIWLSGIQFVDASINKLASAIGYDAESGLFRLANDTERKYDAAEQAIIWSQVFCHLSNWWQECSTAPFGLTVGGLSMGILRSYITPKSISTHKDENAHRLERSACYGGRSSLWFVGSIGNAPVLPIHTTPTDRQHSLFHATGPLRLIDVRSMYPWLLANRTFPCRISGWEGNLCGCDLHSLCGHYGVIATVTISTRKPEYPKKGKTHVHYPAGQFSTVLAGPEILSLNPEKEIIKCHNCVCYVMGKPFAKAASTLLDMRIKARESGNEVWEMFAKSVGNNLGGKLAQRRSILKPRPELLAERQWGEWLVCSTDGERARRFRSYMGLVYEYVIDESGYGPYTPAFAYLTAYGRSYMRAIRELLPHETVVSQDTDGIWVLGDEAYNILVDKGLFGDNPGQLQVKEETDNAVFITPRHYYTDKGWTLAGFTSTDFDVNTMRVNDTQVDNPVTIGTRVTPESIITRNRQSSLTVGNCGGELTPYGWLIPEYIAPPRQL